MAFGFKYWNHVLQVVLYFVKRSVSQIVVWLSYKVTQEHLEQRARDTKICVSSMRSVKFTRVCNDDSYFFSDFCNVYKLVRGEFEYVQTFSSHREFRSDDTLDEALYFIERISLCSEYVNNI